MSPKAVSVVARRSRVELITGEIQTLERFVQDVRVRPMLVAANADVHRLREQIAGHSSRAQVHDFERRLETVERRLHLVRRAITRTHA